MTGFREYTSRSEMERAGWKISSSDSECRNCGQQITWSKSPRQKNVALDAGACTMHFRTCSTGGAPASNQTSAAPPLRGNALATSMQTASDFMALRESLDECAQAVRALCSLLREWAKK
jgi:hypothetical protein